MPTAPTPISHFGTPPSSDDPVNFDTRADALVAHLTPFADECNAVADNVYDNAVEALGAVVEADAAQTAAEAAAAVAIANAAASAASAGAALWASGNYAEGAPARSGINYRVYNARTTGAKPTDPAADPINWRLATTNDLQLVVVTGTAQTAAVGGRYVLTNAAATTLTAPAAPQQGDTFAVKVANGRYDNLVNWNGAKHEGISDATMALNGAYLSLTFIYINATIGWVIV